VGVGVGGTGVDVAGAVTAVGVNVAVAAGSGVEPPPHAVTRTSRRNVVAIESLRVTAPLFTHPYLPAGQA
jgi:hypothetical protein